MISVLDLPHARARTLVSSGAPVFLPVNPVEYHGPHLSLHNDAQVSAGLACDMHARLSAGQDWPLLGVADLELGVGPVPGPGTRPVSYPAVRRAVLSACRALLELGARRVVLVTFHGNPLHNHALQAGVDLLTAAGARAFAPMAMLLRELVSADGARIADVYDTIADPDARATMRASTATDFHAGFTETSLALHYAPATVGDHQAMPPCPPLVPDRRLALLATAARRAGRGAFALEVDFLAAGLSWFGLRPFPGYTSRPDLASAEAGRRLAAHVVDGFVSDCREVFDGAAASRPPFGWMLPVTLGGRVGAATGTSVST